MSESRIWKPHSRIKLRFYKHYVQICASHHKKDNYEKFTLVDLFCGEPRIKFEGNTYIDGSPLIALKKKVKCVFNDISESVVEDVKNLNNKYSGKIIEVFNSDANENIEEILEKVPSYYHSLFYLDPDNASQLSFETIKKIIDHKYIYKDTKEIRRPEILINFPIYSITKNCGYIDKHNQSRCEINTSFFGNGKWKEAFQRGKTPNERRKNLLKTFIERFKPYYKHSYSVLVGSLKSNTPLYYIIFFSIYSKIDDILPNLVNNIEKWKKEDFIREYKYGISKPIDCYNREESLNILKRGKHEKTSKNEG